MSVCICVCEREKEHECVCVRERKTMRVREKEHECVYTCASACVRTCMCSVCVCAVRLLYPLNQGASNAAFPSALTGQHVLVICRQLTLIRLGMTFLALSCVPKKVEEGWGLNRGP